MAELRNNLHVKMTGLNGQIFRVQIIQFCAQINCPSISFIGLSNSRDWHRNENFVLFLNTFHLICHSNCRPCSLLSIPSDPNHIVISTYLSLLNKFFYGSRKISFSSTFQLYGATDNVL